ALFRLFKAGGGFVDSESRDLKPVFEPRSVAVIGASNNPTKWGCIILANIVSYGFRGKIYPVNPSEEKILGIKAYPNVMSVNDEVDLAVIARPAEAVPQHIEECAEAGVKAVIAIAGGFRETGKEGEELEKESVRRARKGGLLLVGPNTMGVYSASVNLCALMPPVSPRKGEVALISQSGNIGTNLLGFGSTVGVGFNKFVSSGNEADIECYEYLAYFGSDPNVKVILLYLEGVRSGRKFMRVAEEVSEKKPVIAYKSGRTQAGVRAAKSHSGAMISPNEIVKAVFKQTGIIQATTVNEMLDLAKSFVNLPLPKGKRVGILTWGGGYGVVASDVFEEAGLDVVSLSDDTIRKLSMLLPPYWSKGNPVDLVGVFDRSIQPSCLDIIAGDLNVDIVAALGFIVGSGAFAGAFGGQTHSKEGKNIVKEWIAKADEESMEYIVKLISKYGKPLVAVTATTDMEVVAKAAEKGVVVYPTIETAASVLSKMVQYAKHKKRKEEGRL
ncbi:MAG: CoA-binding protein, partial [Candidatus Jordarchaeales archaeon]